MTSKEHVPVPPRWLDKLVERYCASDLLEQVMGDLHERYYLHIRKYGEKRTRRRYWIEVFAYLWRAKFKRQPSLHNKPIIIDMLVNYIKIARRNIFRNKAYSTINVLGLALGIGCAILIFSLVTFHMSYDTFHSKKDRIYRITTEFHQEGISREPNVPQPMGAAFRNGYSFAEKVAMVYTRMGSLVSIQSAQGETRFKETVAFAEPELFDILDFPLIQGDKHKALTEANTAIITKRMADRLFGGQNPIDQFIRLDNQWDFRVTGILEDLPVNTDRQEEIYLSYSNLRDYDPWLAGDSWRGVSGGMHCFILLKPDVAPSDVDIALGQVSSR